MKKKTKIDHKISLTKTKRISFEVTPTSVDPFSIPGIDDDPDTEKAKRFLFTIRMQNGLADPSVHTYNVEEDSIERLKQLYLDAHEIDDDEPIGIDLCLLENAGSDLNTLFSVKIRDIPSYCNGILYDAEVVDEDFKLRKEYLEKISTEKIEWAKNKDRENWEIFIITEYVLKNFPLESLAGYAVRILYNQIIAKDAVSAAILLSKLQVLQNQEPLAQKYIETKNKAGERGGRASNTNKMKRLESLLKHMELIMNRNPDLRKQSESICAGIAMNNAVLEDKNLWAQGQGQLEEYLTIFRSDALYKDRYCALFPKTA